MKPITPHDLALQKEIVFRARLKLVLCLLASALCLLALTGCQTPNRDTSTRVQTAAKLAAYVGTTEYLRARPETRPAFVLALEALKRIEAADTVDLPTLLAVVHRLPVKDLRSDRAQMLITSATILLSDFAGALPLEKIGELKPVATAIREGVELAVQ